MAVGRARVSSRRYDLIGSRSLVVPFTSKRILQLRIAPLKREGYCIRSRRTVQSRLRTGIRREPAGTLIATTFELIRVGGINRRGKEITISRLGIHTRLRDLGDSNSRGGQPP